ncbi:MAG TPA: VWA domain-containing protein [Blastocatellia bacterium]|nr:VWA domain-containing protein [Blastocatellia bacterium]
MTSLFFLSPEGVASGERARQSIVQIVHDRSAERPQEPITLRSDLVIVPVRAFDRAGRPVRGLTADDFELFVEGKRQPIIFFSTEGEGEQLSRPLALVLLLDASGSIAATLHQQQSAVQSLLGRLGPQTMLSVIRFSDRPHVVVPFTTAHQDAARALAQMRRVEGPTAIFDALLFAIHHFRTFSSPAVRKIVLLISDGLDTASRIDHRECIRAAEQADVTVYSIHIPLYSPANGYLRPRPPVRGFGDVAQATGGRLFVVGSVAEALRPTARTDLTTVFERILDDIRTQYYLGCAPPESAPKGKYLRLMVRTRRSGVRVSSARGGFYVR